MEEKKIRLSWTFYICIKLKMALNSGPIHFLLNLSIQWAVGVESHPLLLSDLLFNSCLCSGCSALSFSSPFSIKICYIVCFSGHPWSSEVCISVFFLPLEGWISSIMYFTKILKGYELWFCRFDLLFYCISLVSIYLEATVCCYLKLFW